MPIVADNTLVHGVSGLWRAFAMPYWPPAAGGYLYRPLVVATYALDWLVAPAGAWWFHGVNVLWHAGASTAVALLARRWAGDAAGDRKSTRLNSSHGYISYAVFCLKKKKKNEQSRRTA